MSSELKPIWTDGMGCDYSFMGPIEQGKEDRRTTGSRTVPVIEVPLICLRLAFSR